MIQFKKFRTSFGTRQFLWKLVFLLGIILIRAAFLLLIIFCGGVYFRITRDYVWVVADLMRILIICYCIVTCFESIRTLVSHWLGYVTMILALISDNLLQFCHLSGSSNHHRSTMHLLWFSWIWVIWNERKRSHFQTQWALLTSTIRQLFFSSPKNLRFNNNNNKKKIKKFSIYLWTPC